MGRIRPMASALRRGGLRTGRVAAWLVPGPRPRRRSLPRSGPRSKRLGSSRWPVRFAPGARSPHTRPASAHRWMGRGMVSGQEEKGQGSP
jgi:hypothetical protein